MDYEIADLLRNKEKIESLAIITKSLNKTELFSGNQLIDEMKKVNFSQEEAESVMYILMDNGCLEVKKPGKRIEMYLFKINPKIRKYLQNQKKAVDILPKKPPQFPSESYDLLVTYPNDKKFERVNELKLLFPNLKRLFRSAKNELCIVNPYFDEAGTRRIIEDLLEAAKRGVKIKIVVREYGENAKLTKCVDLIKDYFSKEGMLSQLQMKNYYRKETQQIFAIHSKIIISDDDKCYIGSANLTASSFCSNLELGVVLKGRNVRKVKSLFDNLWKVSDLINR